MGSFTRWLSELFFGKKEKDTIEGRSYEEEQAALSLKCIAIQTAVGYIASALGQCEFRTFLEGEEVWEGEYYLWNYSPNPNQNSTQFLQDWVETLFYNNEVLVVEKGGSLYIADAFGTSEDGTREQVYTGICVNGENLGDRKARDVMYFKLNNRDVQPLLAEVCRQYEAIITSAAESYERTAADKGILKIDSVARGSLAEKYNEIKRDLLNNRFRDFFGKKSAVLPLYDGFTYTPHTRNVRNTSEVNDVKTMSDEIYNRVGQAFRIPPSMLRGEVANSAGVTENFIRFGVYPLCDALQEESTRKRYGMKNFTKKSYIMVDSSRMEIGGVFGKADKIEKLISSGVYCIDEIRGKIGETLLGTPEAQKHYITKNFEEIREGSRKEDEE